MTVRQLRSFVRLAPFCVFETHPALACAESTCLAEGNRRHPDCLHQTFADGSCLRGAPLHFRGSKS